MRPSAPRAATPAVIRLFATMDGIDPTLLKALKHGTYVVDPHAVAGAIVRRHEQVGEVRRLSWMLVSGERGELAAGEAECDSAAGADVA
jgi:hypothetical protein